MKAVIFKSPDHPILIEERPDPEPAVGEMVLKVGRCGICGSDATLTGCHGYYEPNSILGHEYSGEVAAIGAGVEGFSIGDVVTAMPMAGCGQCDGCRSGNPVLCTVAFQPYGGGFAPYARVAARSAIRLPAHLSMTDGALVEPLAVALNGLLYGGIEAGARILVIGAGAVGLSVTHWARRLGAAKIAVLVRSTRRAELAAHMGADALVLDGDHAMEEIHAALGGAPDMVVECIGTTGALGKAMELVRGGGTIVSLGFCVNPDPILPAIASIKQLRFAFTMGYTLANFQRAADSLSAGHVEPRMLVTETIGLEGVAAAIDQIRAGSSPHAKIMVDPFQI